MCVCGGSSSDGYICNWYSLLLQDMLGQFLRYYEGFDTRPVFSSVEEMLKWSGLYNLTSRTLEVELIDAGLSPLLIKELVTVSIVNNSLLIFNDDILV